MLLKRPAKQPPYRLNVVITGGSRGLGRAFVKTFSKHGHRVLFTARDQKNIVSTLQEVPPSRTVVGLVADVTKPEDLDNLEFSIERNFMDGVVDVWINNAAIGDGNTAFIDTPLEKVKRIVDTNLYGTMIASQKALDVSAKASPILARKLHLFNVSGAGSDGSGTPEYAVYGATKAGVTQFTRTLQKELKCDRGVGVHLISPGMMATDLLAENVCAQKRIIYNILCEEADKVAETLFPEIIDVVNRGSSGEFLRYMTVLRVMMSLAKAPWNKDRFF